MLDWNDVKDNDFIKIQNANNFSLDILFRKLNIQFEEQFSQSGWTHKAICPFKDHKDDTASFFYNPEENLFHCFGCARGGKAVEFLHFFNGMSKLSAADFLLSHLNKNIILQPVKNDYGKIKESLFDFADKISEWRDKNKESFDYAEIVTYALEAYIKNHLPNDSFNFELFEARKKACLDKLLEFEDFDE